MADRIQLSDGTATATALRLGARTASSAQRRALVDKLTPRESEVFALVVHDKLNEQIAYELAVTGWRSGRLR